MSRGAQETASERPRRRVEFAVESRRAFAAREPQALADFFDAFFTPVYSYVLRMVGDVTLAEDLTQEVFVQIYQKLETYDPGRDPQPWVFAIATNQVRSHWRWRQVREKKSAAGAEWEAAADEVAAPDELPLAVMAQDEARERLRAAVEALPEDMRVPVLLRAYEGLAFEDIAAILEITSVAVRKRYSRALARLRDVLVDEDREAAR